MFHKFWVGETKEERERRIKEEEAAAAVYPEWKRQQDELYNIQNALIFVVFRFFVMFYVTLFRMIKWLIVLVYRFFTYNARWGKKE